MNAKHWGKFGLLVLVVVWGISRLAALDKLPVFADEAIYIRWAQMISNDPKQYLFLPLYDGKTPLQMWLLTIFLNFNRANPVVAGRLLSVTAGLFTMGVLMFITKRLKGMKAALLTAGVLYLLLPYTFFNDRMALIDTLYCLLLAVTFWSLLKLKSALSFRWAMVAGVCFGLTLLTKLPGLTFLLQFLLILWFMPPQLPAKVQKQAAGWFGLAAIIGLSMLYLLRVSELFPFLFQRGADFTFTVQEIIQGQGTRWWFNLSHWVSWQAWYSTVGLWLLISIPLFFKAGRKSDHGRMIVKLVIMAVTMGMYFVIFGKIIYSRYYLPTIIYLIPAGALAVEWLWLNRKRGWLIFCGILITFQGLWFMYPLLTNVNRINLERSDREQYLTEWSAGFGNKEVAAYLKKEALVQPVAVATEGYFGTLPDGLSIYFDHSPLNDRVKIFGVGQPITRITEAITDQAKIKTTYVVVNKNRLNLDYQECCELVAEYPRPWGGAPLLLLKVKSL